MSGFSSKNVYDLVDKIESDTFDKEIFEKAGVFVVKAAIPQDIIAEWQKEWADFYTKSLVDGRNVHKANPVELKENLPPKLATLYKNEHIVNTAKKVFGENVALYNHRFVIKDKYSLDPVFLHQDSCYHLGNLNKCSFFVPLSYAGKSNGALSFYLGTHKYGFLGDAGEINPDSFEIKWPKVTPETNPGDIIIMNSSIWHESGANVAKIDRIVADIILQKTDDPTGKELLAGEWKTDFWYNAENPIKFFANSRVKKMMKLSEELEKLQK